MFGIGGFELFLILLFGFLVFGPEKLPDIAKTVGRAIAKFRNTQADVQARVSELSIIDKDSDEPFKNPLEVIEEVADPNHVPAKKERESSTPKPKGTYDNNINGPGKQGNGKESFKQRKARYDLERAQRLASQKAEKEHAEDEQACEKAEPKLEADPKADMERKGAADADSPSDELGALS